MTGPLAWWRRRYWRRDDAALAQLPGTRPATVITGASQGIGLELARTFAANRSAVLLIARNGDELSEVKSALAADGTDPQSASIDTLALDITAADAAERIASRLAQRDLYVDELVNNAGIGASGPFASQDALLVNQLTALNVTALTDLSRAFLPDMLVRGRGGVINIASLGGFTPGPYQAAYYASKAYVITLTRAMSHEYRGRGVRFAAVAPGPVNTDFHAKMDAENTLYRTILPALSARRVAKATLFWYKLGSVIIVPGLLNQLLALALRILPGFLIIPVMALLLHPWSNERDI